MERLKEEGGEGDKEKCYEVSRNGVRKGERERGEEGNKVGKGGREGGGVGVGRERGKN